MAKIRELAPGIWYFTCPACGYGHPFHVTHPESPQPNHPKWEWNGSTEKPTFRPSLMVNGAGIKGSPRCHSFVTDGKIQFLSDCQHAMAGKIVDLPDVDA